MGVRLTPASPVGDGDSKTRGEKNKPPAQEGKTIEPRGREKNQPKLSSHDTGALLPWKEIKGRVK